MATKVDDEFTDLDLLDEIHQYQAPEERKPGGFTHADYMRKFNCSDRTAAKHCKALVDSGEFYRVKCHLGGHSVGWVYYKKAPNSSE